MSLLKKMKNKLSVVLAVYNEENNLGACLQSVRELADEIIIVDGGSQDKTLEIAKTFGAKVEIRDNPPIFHINKQRALDLAANEWILQLDADERVSHNLVQEIEKIIDMEMNELEDYQTKIKNKKLFLRHQKIIEERGGKIGFSNGAYNAFFIPRLNYFLGKFLKYGGVYPDGVIRLVRKNKAHFPCKSVHEQIEVMGRVGWLQNDLLHLADYSFKKYLQRNSKYIDLIVDELKVDKVGKNLFKMIEYFFVKPVWWFLLTQVRHKGIFDGWQGIVFSFFSALRFPRAYFRFITKT